MVGRADCGGLRESGSARSARSLRGSGQEREIFLACETGRGRKNGGSLAAGCGSFSLGWRGVNTKLWRGLRPIFFGPRTLVRTWGTPPVRFGPLEKLLLRLGG